MPRRRTQSTQRALLLGTVAVLVGFALLLGLAWAAGRGTIDPANLGDRNVEVGDAQRLAGRIAEDGPFILPDVSPNRDRVVFLQHVGPGAGRGWHTILANGDGCVVRWTGRGFRDCQGRSFPADGRGLVRYRTWVDEGNVHVDLRTVLP
jgi:hypothetical protein